MLHPADDPRLTQGRFLADVAARHGERRAIVFEGRELRYADLEGEARQLARALVGAGVVKGARVAVYMANRPEFVATAYAVGLVGGVLVPVNTFASAAERDYILRHSDASLLLMQPSLLKHAFLDDLRATHPELASGTPGRLRSPALPNLRRVACLGDVPEGGGIESWDAFLAHGADVDDALVDALCDEVEPSDEGVIIYTSGTTAEPKGVLHSQRAGVLQSWRFADLLRLGPEDRVFSPYPFFWTAGLAMSLGGPLAAGACLLLQETFEPGAALELIERERATAVYAWPHQHKAMGEHPSAGKRDLTSVHKTEFASPLAKLAGMEKDTYSFGSSYGLSETFTLSSMIHADAPAEIRRACHGRPLDGMDVRIVDPETGEPVPAGQAGEITVKGVTLMRGYYKVLPERFLDAYGYFHTQDGGSLDEEGYLHWTGRLSNLIKTGGANVSPVEIEAALAGYPGLKLGVPVGVPHPTLGEAIVLCAVPAEGRSVDAAEIRTWLRERLAAYKVPRHVLVFDESDLSYTSNQKVQTAPLRDAALARLESEGAEIDGHRYGA